jgi:hypothetical protein
MICNSYFLLDSACRLEKFKKSEGVNFLGILSPGKRKNETKKEKVTRVAAARQKFGMVFV